MFDKFLKITLFFLGILVIANLLFLDFVWFEKKESPVAVVKTQKETDNIQHCDSSCQEEIQKEVKRAVAVPTSVTAKTVKEESAAVPTLIPTSVTAQSSSVSFISIGSSGSTSETSWTDIPGTEFYFNLVDYSNLKSVRWEVNLRSFLAGNAVSVRIYDATNSRAVDSSELSTTSGASVIVRSNDLSIWRGNNLYRVQAKSSSGNPVYLDAPRLKIFLE
ncbi:MAG: hypothetical protein Q8Q15_01115 [bacterium]|nr:hypothetical protein [bacterium]